MRLFQIRAENQMAGICAAIIALVSPVMMSVSARANDTSNTFNVRHIEEVIAKARGSELSKLEIKIARKLQASPSDVEANYLMSTLLLRMFTQDPGSYSLIRQSTELAAQTYDLDRKNELSIAALANILETSGEADRGLALLSDAKKQGIKLGWRAGLAQAKLTFNGRNPDAALKILDVVLRDENASKDLVSPVLISVLASKYEGDDLVHALRLWEKRCQSTSLDLAIANALAISARYDDAMAAFGKILSYDTGNAEAALSRGIIALRHKQNTDLAISMFRVAIENAVYESDKKAAQTHLALALITQGKSEHSSASASIEAIKNATDEETVLVAILAAYRRHSTTLATLRFLENLESSVPGLHLAYALKAELLNEKLSRHEEAMRSFTNAITLEPGRSEYYNGRGLTWMNMGKLETALMDFESAAATNPDDAAARYNVACAHARLGHKDEAIASLSKAIELDDRLLNHAKTDQDLASIRSAPEFKSMLDDDVKRVNAAH